MQGQAFEQCKIRRSMWDGPIGYSYAYSNVTATYNLSPNTPYVVILNPAATPQNVQMYNPTALGAAPSVMWCHEIINVGATGGTLTIKGAAGGTVGTLAIGKRAEVVWNPALATPEWVVFLSA